MTVENAVLKYVTPRKRPMQARSLLMVERILTAASTLLKQKKLAELTTTHIANKADISVGSLYQYFPSKEAILYALYEQMLTKLRVMFEVFEQEPYASLAWEEFVEQMVPKIRDFESKAGISIDLIKAMKTNAILQEVDKAHAESVSEWEVNTLRRLGSKWPIKKLRELTLYSYYINHATWLYREHSGMGEKESILWEIDIVKSLWRRCF